MTKTLHQLNVRIDADLRDSLEALRVRDGVSYTEQLRRALRLWFDSRGLAAVPTKARLERPLYPDLPGGARHPQQFGKPRAKGRA